MDALRTRQVVEDDPHDHDRGLAFDISTLMTRRRALGLVAVAGLAALVGCGGSDDTPAAATTSPGTTAATTTGMADATVAEVPEETAGPYPADGSNGPDVLTRSGVVREDITGSFGGASGVAEGIPLRVDLTILDVAAGGTPVAGAAVYLWHCDREGRYSIYDSSIAAENYLRGVQASDAEGALSFTTVFPGCYAGRWPHMHFEVFATLDDATSGGGKLVTSQIALPEDVCAAVYATSGYERSAANLGGVSLATDMVFADGYSTQLGRASGGATAGDLAIRLNVGV